MKAEKNKSMKTLEKLLSWRTSSSDHLRFSEINGLVIFFCVKKLAKGFELSLSFFMSEFTGQANRKLAWRSLTMCYRGKGPLDGYFSQGQLLSVAISGLLHRGVFCRSHINLRNEQKCWLVHRKETL
jgi:hypothetical protein